MKYWSKWHHYFTLHFEPPVSHLAKSPQKSSEPNSLQQWYQLWINQHRRRSCSVQFRLKWGRVHLRPSGCYADLTLPWESNSASGVQTDFYMRMCGLCSPTSLLRAVNHHQCELTASIWGFTSQLRFDFKLYSVSLKDTSNSKVRLQTDLVERA